MKVTQEITFKFSFEMKDKTIYPFKVQSDSEKNARAILTEHMGQILDQIELADRAQAEKDKLKSPIQVAPPAQG